MKQIKLTDSNFKKLGKLKKSTIRIGIKDYTVGRTTIVNVDTQETVDCLIREVKLMTVRDLDHRHALDDGFHSLGELFKELRSLYGRLSPDNWVTLVRFSAQTPKP